MWCQENWVQFNASLMHPQAAFYYEWPAPVGLPVASSYLRSPFSCCEQVGDCKECNPITSSQLVKLEPELPQALGLKEQNPV